MQPLQDGLSLPALSAVSWRTAPEVFHANEWGIAWGREVIEELKSVARTSSRHRSRLCLHPEPTSRHQEMLIVLGRDAVEEPQRRAIGFDSKIVIEGEATLRYFSEDGVASRNVRLGGDGSSYVHTCSDEFHSLLVQSDWFVFVEILEGPFDAMTTEFATWHLPTEDENRDQ